MRVATALVALLLVSASCSTRIDVPLELDPGRASPGAVRSIERVAGYPSPMLRLMIWWSGLSERVPVRHGITLFRLEYWTTRTSGERTYGSGLIAFPRTDALRGVVSYQHGTVTLRDGVPSAPSPDEGVVAAAVFAGQGYLLVAPDYLGLGTSEGTHPYLHADAAATAVTDLLVAARRVVTARGMEWPEHLFLTGFSQGGHASLAAHRALEAAPRDGLRVSATAALAGPYDLARISFPFALAGHSRASSLYLAYMVHGYSGIYGEPVGSVMREPYDAALPRLFDGSKSEEEIAAALPRQPREMFEPAFLARYDTGEETWLLRRLAENSLHDWTPRAPIRLYYGSLDLDVTPDEARVEAERLTARGGSVRAIGVGDFDHNGSVVEAIPDLRAWFDELAGSADPPPNG